MVSLWWKDLCAIGKSMEGDEDSWFKEGFIHIISNRYNTSFWSNHGLDVGCLRTRFRRLFLFVC